MSTCVCTLHVSVYIYTCYDNSVIEMFYYYYIFFFLYIEHVPFENMAPGQFRPERVRQSHGELLKRKKLRFTSDDNYTKETVGKLSRLIVIMTVS